MTVNYTFCKISISLWSDSRRGRVDYSLGNIKINEKALPPKKWACNCSIFTRPRQVFPLPTVNIPQTMCRRLPRATGTGVPKVILHRDLGGGPFIGLRKPVGKNGGGSFGGGHALQ
jgi:hypothetical protein